MSNTMLKDIQMLDLFKQFNMDLDSTSFFNLIVNGAFNVKLEFPKDSLIFKTLSLANADLIIYELVEKDTIISKSLTIQLNDVYYDLRIDANPLATLTTSGIIDITGFRTNRFDVENIKLDVSAKNGCYEIVPQSERLFGPMGSGVITMQPWVTVPSYRLKYTVKQFAVEDWLASFLDDPVLTGNMSLNIDIQMIGNNWDNWTRELNGSIYSEGHDLQLYGLDVAFATRKNRITAKVNVINGVAEVLAMETMSAMPRSIPATYILSQAPLLRNCCTIA